MNFKRLKATILALGVFLYAPAAFAQATATDLINLGMSPELASVVAGITSGSAVLPNATWLKGRNVGNTANINIAEVDAGDNTVINSSASDVLILQLEDDASRLVNFTAASDAAINTTWGDAGTTDTQIWTVAASTSDGGDDSSLILCGGGGTAGTRGACITLPGEEVSGGSDITLNAGTSDTIIAAVAGSAISTTSTTGISVTGSVTVSNAFILTGASGKIIPGATSLLIRNNGDTVSNLSVADAGTVTHGTATDYVHSVGLSTMALQEAVAGTACMGTLTANGATPVVTSTTCAITGSRIFLSRTSAETGVVTAWVSAISTGVSFSVTGEAGDTGTYNWIIFHESP